ncbi:MAG: NAD(P)H-dependent oxidoreductase subunit E [Bacteroidales bacterium]
MDIRKILLRYSPEKTNLLNILHDIQDAHPQNYLPDEILREVAAYLNTTVSSVYGVVKYYTMFSTKPRAKYIVRVCQSPICHLMGHETVLENLRKVLKVGINEPTPDGLFYIELSECLGICDVAPAMMIGQEPYGNLTEGSIASVISELRSKS